MNLLEWCKENNTSLQKMAESINMNGSTITRIANGTRRTVKSTVDKIHEIAPEVEFVKEVINNREYYKIKKPNGYLKRKIQVGETYGYLTILEDIGKRGRSGNICWLCRCVCGKELTRSTESIIESDKKGCVISCGCKKPSDVGRRELNNPIRIKRAKESQGIVEGTMLCNLQRKNMNKNNTSGVRGVYWKKREQKWVGGIEFKRKQYRKLFDTKEEAIAYRKYLEDKYFKPILEKYERDDMNVK